MEHILLIEDKIAHIELIETYLEQADYDHRLYKTHSLQDGLDMIRHHKIDIVLLDLGLVDSAGYNTLRVFKTDVHNVPVIVLTAYDNDVLRIKTIQAGAQDFLVKNNFDEKQLVHAIRHAILRYKAQVKLQEDLWNLRNREQRLLQLNQLALLGELEMDVLNNDMMWSDKTYELLGYHPKSFSPKFSDYLRTIHSEDLELVNNAFQEAGKNGKAFQVEHRAVISNSRVKHLLLKGEVTSEEASGKILLIGILQDVTAIKKTESAAINVTSSSDNLPETLSHLSSQMRKPLSKLQNYIEQVEKLDDPIYAEIAKESKLAIIGLTDLAYKQMNTATLATLRTQRELVQLSDWKDEIERLLKLKALEERVQLFTQWDERLAEQFYTDERLLSLLIFNSIHILLKYRTENEALHIHFISENPDTLRIILVASKRMTALHKRKELTERLKIVWQSQPSSTVEESLRTSMLRLTKILKMLGGSIRSSKNQDIELKLPLERYQQEENEESDPSNNPATMLVIEHQPIMQIDIKRMIRSSSLPPIDLDFVSDLEKGIQKYNEKKYDILLIDIQSPVLSSIKFIRQLNVRKPTKIIALAAAFSETDKSFFYELGVKTLLTKPLKREEFLPPLSRLLES